MIFLLYAPTRTFSNSLDGTFSQHRGPSFYQDAENLTKRLYKSGIDELQAGLNYPKQGQLSVGFFYLPVVAILKRNRKIGQLGSRYVDSLPQLTLVISKTS